MTNENKKTTHQKKDSHNEISAEYIDTGIINPLSVRDLTDREY